MFTGLSAFPLTPLDEDGIDEGAFARLVARLAEAGVDSIAPLGSTGSYAYLQRTERARLTRLAVEAAQGVPVMVGIGALRTRDVLAHAHDAQAAGASAVLLAPVSYQLLTDDEVLSLYSDVTAELSVPLCVYDNPRTTQFAFSDDLHVAIAQLPHVRAIKLPGDGAAARIAGLRARVPESVALGVSGDWFAAEALRAGADVWFSVIGGLFPEPALAIARGEDVDLEPLWDLFRRYGGIRVVATAAVLRGFTGEPNLPRPLRPAPADEVGPVLDELGL
ncbi:dihydrodipicolinate synthase family protein [Solirubrobacter pauli]|nr:dihydrodipicolinate synthase family protein [Solirubrobacter pauli]